MPFFTWPSPQPRSTLRSPLSSTRFTGTWLPTLAPLRVPTSRTVRAIQSSDALSILCTPVPLLNSARTCPPRSSGLCCSRGSCPAAACSDAPAVVALMSTSPPRRAKRAPRLVFVPSRFLTLAMAFMESSADSAACFTPSSKGCASLAASTAALPPFSMIMVANSMSAETRLSSVWRALAMSSASSCSTVIVSRMTLTPPCCTMILRLSTTKVRCEKRSNIMLSTSVSSTCSPTRNMKMCMPLSAMATDVSSWALRRFRAVTVKRMSCLLMKKSSRSCTMVARPLGCCESSVRLRSS
mmetsp:Transcript_12960/g.43854  ORF Transcript_12960/g.43854 Transcript_12960/m.43854 type:complete len:297 (+) Transcript_12960:483-1373(+)